jgi:hypothetical protein
MYLASLLVVSLHARWVSNRPTGDGRWIAGAACVIAVALALGFGAKRIQIDPRTLVIAISVLGLVTLAPLGVYGTIFGSGWLWSGLDDDDLDFAALTLEAIAEKDPGRIGGLVQQAGQARAGRSMQALAKLDLLCNGPDGIALTGAGEDLIDRAMPK